MRVCVCILMLGRTFLLLALILLLLLLAYFDYHHHNYYGPVFEDGEGAFKYCQHVHVHIPCLNEHITCK